MSADISTYGKWYFFFFQGLEITNNSHDLENPLFYDTTILSDDNILGIIECDSREHHIDFLSLTTHSSIIAVRNDTSVNNSNNDKIQLLCFNRAKEIGALLSIYSINQQFTLQSGLIYQPFGFINDIFKPRLQYTFTIDFSDPRPSYHIKRINDDDMICDMIKKCNVSREDIRRNLSNEVYKNIASILGFKTANIDLTFRKAIKLAAINYYHSVHNPNIDQQLLGMLTTLEVLLRIPNDDYDKFKKRLNLLVGDDIFNGLDVVKILTARHNYVHRTKQITDNMLVMKSIILATYSIIKFADYTQIYNTKDHIINEMDVGSFNRI